MSVTTAATVGAERGNGPSIAVEPLQGFDVRLVASA